MSLVLIHLLIQNKTSGLFWFILLSYFALLRGNLRHRVIVSLGIVGQHWWNVVEEYMYTRNVAQNDRGFEVLTVDLDF